MGKSNCLILIGYNSGANIYLYWRSLQVDSDVPGKDGVALIIGFWCRVMPTVFLRFCICLSLCHSLLLLSNYPSTKRLRVRDFILNGSSSSSSWCFGSWAVLSTYTSPFILTNQSSVHGLVYLTSPGILFNQTLDHLGANAGDNWQYTEGYVCPWQRDSVSSDASNYW